MSTKALQSRFHIILGSYVVYTIKGKWYESWLYSLQGTPTHLFIKHGSSYQSFKEAFHIDKGYMSAPYHIREYYNPIKKD